jgi:hypothetical protein
MSDIAIAYGSDRDSEITALVFEHYIKHRDVVLRKIQHARSATHQSIQDYDGCEGRLKDSQEFKNITKYDEFWHVIINMFKETNVSEEGLQRIEDILLSIPRRIKKYYDLLILNDRPLLQLMKEIAADKYKAAYKEIRKIKKSADPKYEGYSSSNSNSSAAAGQEYILKRIESIKPPPS